MKIFGELVSLLRWPVFLLSQLAAMVSIYFDGQDASRIGFDWWIWAVLGNIVGAVVLISVAYGQYREKVALQDWKKSFEDTGPRLRCEIENSYSSDDGSDGFSEVAIRIFNEPVFPLEKAVAKRVYVKAELFLLNEEDDSKYYTSSLYDTIDVNGIPARFRIAYQPDNEWWFIVGEQKVEWMGEIRVRVQVKAAQVQEEWDFLLLNGPDEYGLSSFTLSRHHQGNQPLLRGRA
ncbi:MAG TPA: hypothetical protein VFX19_06875 [Dehalococcoidia bacterium]|nr:hypothetical protein [Dehalococcoidia bacterium]